MNRASRPEGVIDERDDHRDTPLDFYRRDPVTGTAPGDCQRAFPYRASASDGVVVTRSFEQRRSCR